MIIFFLWAVGNLEVHLDSSFTIIPILRHLSDISGICHFLMTSTPTVPATLTLFSPRLCSVLSPGLLLPGLMSSDLTFLLPPGWSRELCRSRYFLLTLYHLQSQVQALCLASRPSTLWPWPHLPLLKVLSISNITPLILEKKNSLSSASSNFAFSS